MIGTQAHEGLNLCGHSDLPQNKCQCSGKRAGKRNAQRDKDRQGSRRTLNPELVNYKVTQGSHFLEVAAVTSA